MTTVLVVDDEPIVRDVVVRYLRREGFDTIEAADGDTARELIERSAPQLVVLDVMLPGTDGLALCRWIRSRGELPVIMLTARGEEADRIVGLELGADDYVTKPFSPREVVARVKAILRRGEIAATPRGDPTSFEIAVGIVVDTARREATVHGQPVALATREFELLAHLARNIGLALTRQQLLDAVWGVDWIGDDRTVDVHVRQLRRKLGDDLPLATVWGVGYRLG